LFAFIGFPHADNAACFTARRPDHHDHPAIQFANRDVASLAVVVAGIFKGEMPARENLGGSREINLPFSKRPVALFRVEFDLHDYCSYDNMAQQALFVTTTFIAWIGMTHPGK
jgi:hypothetical protein